MKRSKLLFCAFKNLQGVYEITYANFCCSGKAVAKICNEQENHKDDVNAWSNHLKFIIIIIKAKIHINLCFHTCTLHGNMALWCVAFAQSLTPFWLIVCLFNFPDQASFSDHIYLTVNLLENYSKFSWQGTLD